MRRGGGMISFEIKGGLENTKKFTEKLHEIEIAESLGGTETKINVPGLMTHLSVPKHERKLLGITDTLIRLSIGTECIRDLLTELDECLEHSQEK